MARTLATPVPSSNDLLYVANVGNNSITVYKHDAQGDTAPLRVISGSKTGIVHPGQLSQDAEGNLYVANYTSVLVFAHGANGDVPPIREITGPTTEIQQIGGMTVDKATGKLFIETFIASMGPSYPDAAILRFAPNANGNTAPYALGLTVSEEGIANEITSDSTGNNLIMWVGAEELVGSGEGFDTLAKQFAGGTSPGSPYRTYNEFGNGLVDDPSTKTYLFTGSYQVCKGSSFEAVDGISRFAENTTGYAASSEEITCGITLKPAPVSVITSDTCGTQLALGYLRNLYVAHSKASGGCASDAIYVYEHDATGNVQPIRILSGSATKLNNPSGIYEGT